MTGAEVIRFERHAGPVAGLLLVVLLGCSGSPPAPDDASSDAAPAAAGEATAGAAQSGVPDRKRAISTRWIDAVVPAETVLEVTLLQPVSSAGSQTGALVRSRLNAPVIVDRLEVLPEGSTIEGFLGSIILAANGGDGGGSVVLKFRQVRTPTWSSAGISARLTGVRPGAGGSDAAIFADDDAPGTIIMAGKRGEELVLNEATVLTLVLTAPLSIKVKQ